MSPLRIIRAHHRVFAAASVGVLAVLLLPRRWDALSRGIGAWDLGCLTLLVLAALLFTLERRSTMAQDAAAQEEGEWSIFAVVVGATAVSVAAVIGEFSLSKSAGPDLRSLRVALVAATLLATWLVTHTLFAMRYAHEYYSLDGASGRPEGGLQFPSEVDPDYWDFFYFALVLGMTFQVSDVQISSRKLRRLATLHGLLGFLYNTVIIALTVNVGASLL